MNSYAPDSGSVNAVLDEVVFVIVTYNQAEYLEGSLGAALNQTCLPGRFLIMDDASDDGSADLIEKILKQAPKNIEIEFIKNNENVGLAAQLNKLVGRFSEKLIVVQAGDDESYSERLEETYGAWLTNGKPSLVLANHDDIDEKGNVLVAFKDKRIKLRPYTLTRIINRRALVFGCCAAFTSDLINYYGPMNEDVINEDRVNAFRAYFRHGIFYLNKPLLRYQSKTGISFFANGSSDQLLNRIITESVRELADIECHLKDASKLKNRKAKKLLMKRKKSVMWASELQNEVGVFDALKAAFGGVQIFFAIKQFRRFRKKHRR